MDGNIKGGREKKKKLIIIVEALGPRHTLTDGGEGAGGAEGEVDIESGEGGDDAVRGDVNSTGGEADGYFEEGLEDAVEGG